MRQIIVFALIFLTFSHSYGQNFSLSRNLESIDLWNGNIPDHGGSRGSEIISSKGSVTGVSIPRLIVHRPEHSNGTAILVISGGGMPISNWEKRALPLPAGCNRKVLLHSSLFTGFRRRAGPQPMFLLKMHNVL